MDKQPIGISYPIRRGQSGFFEQSFETKESIRDSLANLILTPKKTRPGRPEYGSSIHEFLFEQTSDNIGMETVLREDISQWIPSIEIISIKSEDLDFENTVKLEIKYKIKNTPLIDELLISVSP